MAYKGLLGGLTSAELNSLRAAAFACLLAGNVRGVTYMIANRSFGFPSLADASQLLFEADNAPKLLTGNKSMYVRVNYNPSMGRGSGFP